MGIPLFLLPFLSTDMRKQLQHSLQVLTTVFACFLNTPLSLFNSLLHRYWLYTYNAR